MCTKHEILNLSFIYILLTIILSLYNLVDHILPTFLRGPDQLQESSHFPVLVRLSFTLDTTPVMRFYKLSTRSV